MRNIKNIELNMNSNIYEDLLKIGDKINEIINWIEIQNKEELLKKIEGSENNPSIANYCNNQDFNFEDEDYGIGENKSGEKLLEEARTYYLGQAEYDYEDYYHQLQVDDKIDLYESAIERIIKEKDEKIHVFEWINKDHRSQINIQGEYIMELELKIKQLKQQKEIKIDADIIKWLKSMINYGLYPSRDNDMADKLLKQLNIKE